MLFFEYYTKYNSCQPNTKCLLHLLRRGQYISYIIMYYRSPCLFFRNTVRSASSCFGVRQAHYGARGLWPDHACARGLWPDHARALGLLARPLRARGLARPLRALGLLARPLRAQDSTTIAKAIVYHVDHHVRFPRRRPVSSGRPDPI